MQRHCFCSLLSLFFYTLALSLFFQFVEFAHVTVETDQTNQCGQSRQKRGGGSVERIDHHLPHIGVYIVQHQLQQQWQVGFVNSFKLFIFTSVDSAILGLFFFNNCHFEIFLHLTTTTSLASHMFFLTPERCCCRRKKTAAEPLGTECWNCCCCSPLAASKVGQGEAAFAATAKRNIRVRDMFVLYMSMLLGLLLPVPILR